jgi:hypothetical protein
MRLLAPAAAACFSIAALALSGAQAGEARSKQIETLSQALLRDPSYKVRLQAAVVLARVGNARAVPALIQGLADPVAAVRAMSAQALGSIGVTSARAALERSSREDGDPFVRERARDALRRMLGTPAPTASAGAASSAGDRGRPSPSDPTRTLLAVGAMGNKSQRGARTLLHRMRDFVRREVDATPGVGVARDEEAARRRFTLEGSITELARHDSPHWIEISCEVSLILSSYPSGSIVAMTSGGASVQHPRDKWRPSLEPSLEESAVENAVKAAHQDLVKVLHSKPSPR